MELWPRTEQEHSNADAHLATNLRQLRQERGLTLDALALRSGVSRAMISKIERGTAVPTATVLGKLAFGLEVGLSRLVGEQRTRAPVFLTPATQAIFRDPDTGFERRSLSPLFSDRFVDFAINTLPAGAAAVFPPHPPGIEEYLFVRTGVLIVIVDGEQFQVRAGASLFYPGHVAHEFRNETNEPVEFFIVVDGTGAR